MVFDGWFHHLTISAGYRKGVDIGWPVMPILSNLRASSIDCTVTPKYLVTFKGARDSIVRSNLGKLNDPDNRAFACP